MKELFKKPGDQIDYVYDMGGQWTHRIVFRGRKYETALFGYPQCVAGARSFPPEDGDGLPGYMNLLGAIAGKDKARLKHYDEWLGYRYDPDDFDAESNRFF